MPTRVPSHKPHRLASRPRRDETARPSAAARGYCDKAHRAWRRAVLTRDAWQCRACGRVCSGDREAHADHIVPVSAGGERYSVANGQCLCASCHGRKTRGEQAAASGHNVWQTAASGLAPAEGRVGRITGALREVNPGCLWNEHGGYVPYGEVAPR
jgi:5-methylcytosine-specific restriction endonuclease McrA